MPLVKFVSLVARALIAVGIAAGAVVLTVVPAGATPSPDDQLVALINRDRAAAGLRALNADTELARIAGVHSQDMVDQQQIFHTPNLGSVVPSWLVVDENVATGGAPDQIERGFMSSPVHRANVLDRRVTQIGVGIVDVGGQLWVTVLFRLPSTVAVAQVPAAVTTVTTAAPRTPAPRPAPATPRVAPPTTAPTLPSTPASTSPTTASPASTVPAAVPAPPPAAVSAGPVAAPPVVRPAAVPASRSASLGGHNAILAVGMLIWLAGAAIVRRGTADVLAMRRRATAMQSHPSQLAVSVS